MQRCASGFEWVIVTSLALLAGCVDAADQRCADGTLCPAALACSSQGCVLPEQLDVCAGAADLTPCSYRDVDGGQCLDEVCVLVVCGNGEVEGDETCDDGNRVDGDGCAGDCRSREGCGNGVRDVTEECDDGNAVDGDGCQATCVLPECGDGVVDAGLDEVCDDGNRVDGDGCAAACDSDETCGNGLRDATEACDDGNLIAGDGCQADCALPTCGDAISDLGNLEACDDGNRDGGDGCSADCRSDETCGNEIADVGAGEPCDFGAGASGDGCDSTCALELPAWTALAPGATPPRMYGVGAWFASRGYAVVAGGLVRVTSPDYDFADASFALVGAAIAPIAGTQPSPRYYHQLAYSGLADALVLFGGASVDDNALAFAADTWLFDGRGWHDVSADVGVAPAPRAGPVMAADPVTGDVILFGGLADDGATMLGDTWRFDGATWHELPIAGPPARFASVMAADPQSGKLLLFGGFSTTNLTDTWLFDGASWTAYDGPAPSVIQDVALVRDPDGPGLLLVGTASPTTQQRWRWADGGWVRLADIANAEIGGAVLYDPTRDRLVRYGGAQQLGPSESEGTSSYAELVGDAWQPVVAADDAAPIATNAGPAAADVLRGEVVVAAGSQGTWVWDTRRWRRVPGAAPTDDATMAGLPSHGTVIAFGDYGDSSTWTWSGGGWSKAALAPNPGVFSPSMAYDAARGAIVLFGGMSGAGASPTSTWTYDGAAWTPLATVGAPPGRSRAMMAYDQRGDRIVLFGGVERDDTWVLEGDTWRELVVATRPRARAWAGMSYLTARGTVILASGNQNGDGVDLADTWELDDETWRQLATQVATPRHALTALIDAPWRSGLVRVGGSRSLGDVDAFDPWHFGYQPIVPSSRPTDEACDALVAGDADGDGLVGCDDPDCVDRCYPLASAATAAAIGLPSCGDGVCQLPREATGLCALDCDVCGDGVCAIGFESSTSCAADCDLCGDGVCGVHEAAASCAADCA